MRNRFQLILSISITVIVFAGFMAFTFFSQKLIYNEVLKQAVLDNKVIGDAIVKLIAKTEHGNMLLKELQETCDAVTLPNNGYLCVVNTQGRIVAMPGASEMPNMEMYLDQSELTTVFGKQKKTLITKLDKEEIFQGLILNQNNQQIEIISSLPIKMSDLRILVHQSTLSIDEKANAYAKEFLIWGFLTSIIVGLSIYFFATKIINSYESKIEQKNKELNIALTEITQQKEKIAKISESITQSIQYALNIQKAILPPNEAFEELLPQHFVIFKPRDIVSGDFYWIKEVADKLIVIAADCTGHGVPGAFMSMLGVAFLNEIVTEQNLQHENSASQILDELRIKVKTSLRQKGEYNEQKDGMDIALCILDRKNNYLDYAGANNPLLVVRKKGTESELIELKADKQPIGIYVKEREFVTKRLQTQNGDKFYIFSDGFIDQFGGEKGRKFMKTAFKELLLNNYSKDFSAQKEIFLQTYNNWTSNQYEQVDDILIIGFS